MGGKEYWGGPDGVEGNGEFQAATGSVKE